MADSDIEKYEAGLRRLSAVSELLTKAAVRDSNRLMNVTQSLYLRLRETVEGRLAIERLAADPDARVRLSAATHLLAWKPANAHPILERLRDDPTDRTMAGFNAKYVLIEYDAGRLKPDWVPKETTE